jgi:hypothetical protein
MKKRKTVSAIDAASALANFGWKENLNACGTTGDFLRDFTTAGINALAVAACDKSLSHDERAAAAYSLASAIKHAALALQKAFPHASGNVAAPDCGIIRSVTAAVKVFHETAAKNPKSFTWIRDYPEWPVNIAPDGKVYAYCKMPDEMGNGELFENAGLPKPKKGAGKGRSSNLGGLWTSLATEMHYKSQLGNPRITIKPPKGKTRWQAWDRVSDQLEESKAEILNRPLVKAWAAKKKGLRSKDYTIWGDLKALVKDALRGIAQR